MISAGHLLATNDKITSLLTTYFFIFSAIRWEGWKCNYYHFPGLLFIFRNFIKDFAIIFYEVKFLWSSVKWAVKGNYVEKGIDNLFSNSIKFTRCFTTPPRHTFHILTYVHKVIMVAAVSLANPSWWNGRSSLEQCKF